MLAFWSLKIVKCVCVFFCGLLFTLPSNKARISPLDDMQVGKVKKVWMMDELWNYLKNMEFIFKLEFGWCVGGGSRVSCYYEQKGKYTHIEILTPISIETYISPIIWPRI